MTRVRYRMDVRQCHGTRDQAVKAAFKKMFRKTAAMVLVFAMVFSMAGVPPGYAFFTAHKETEKLYFKVITPPPNTSAIVNFTDDFLFEKDTGEAIEMSFTQKSGTDIFSWDSTGDLYCSRESSIISFAGLDETSRSLLAGEQAELFEEALDQEKFVRAAVTLENGFDSADIYIPSVELWYGDCSVTAAAGEIQNGEMVVSFDRQEVLDCAGRHQADGEAAVFIITGEGYVEGLERFTFAGEAAVPVWGSYETKHVEIGGPPALLLPETGGAASHAYTLTDQDGNVLGDARWALKSPYPGVKIGRDSGLLIAGYGTEEGSVTIVAAVLREGRVLAAEKTVGLHEDPQLKIQGPEVIFVPSGGKTTVDYTVISPVNAVIDSVAWGLGEPAGSVEVSAGGAVTVTGIATVSSFNLVAVANVWGIPVRVEKQLYVNIIPGGSGTPSSPEQDQPAGTVEISGPETILAPAAGEVQLSYLYEAVVLDPAGNPVPEAGVAWSLAQEVAGIILAEAGPGTVLVIVSSGAGTGTLHLQAVSLADDKLAGTKEIKVDASPPSSPPDQEGAGGGGGGNGGGGGSSPGGGEDNEAREEDTGIGGGDLPDEPGGDLPDEPGGSGQPDGGPGGEQDGGQPAEGDAGPGPGAFEAIREEPGGNIGADDTGAGTAGNEGRGEDAGMDGDGPGQDGGNTPDGSAT